MKKTVKKTLILVSSIPFLIFEIVVIIKLNLASEVGFVTAVLLCCIWPTVIGYLFGEKVFIGGSSLTKYTGGEDYQNNSLVILLGIIALVVVGIAAYMFILPNL